MRCGAGTHGVTGQKDGIPMYGGLGLAASGVQVDQADLDVLVITARQAPAHLVKSVFCCCSAAGCSFLTRKVPSESSRRALFCGADGGGVRARRSRPPCFVITLTESRHVDRIAKRTDTLGQSFARKNLTPSILVDPRPAHARMSGACPALTHA